MGQPRLSGAPGSLRGLQGARPAFYSRTAGATLPGYAGARLLSGQRRDGRFRFGYPRYVYPAFGAYGFLDPFWGFADDFGYGAQPYSADNEASPGPVQEPDGLGPVSPEPYPAPGAPPPPSATATVPLPEEDAVTLVFKDGRPSEQVQNYALTRTALILPGAHLRQISVEEIDLPATERLNRAAGITFQLPQ